MQASLRFAHRLRPVLALIALAGLAVFAATDLVYAQSSELETTESAATTVIPYAEFQYATLTATTNTINVTLLPVVLSNGSLVYENLTIPFTVTESATGAITITAGTITAVASPIPQITSFKAGPYVGPGGGTSQLITLSGPGETVGGATEWSVSESAGATECTFPNSAMFYVSSQLSSNPLYARLKKAGITSTAYSYGILGEQGCGGGWWETGAILGFSQTGNALTVVSFTNGGTDQNTPGAQITYTFK